MVDVEALALLSAAETLKLNGMGAEIFSSDGLGGLEASFDLIISNPPFHQGHKTKSRMSMHLLEDAGNYLNANGSVVVVVNRHLPYSGWLEGKFRKTQVLASNSQYQVLHATQSR